MAVSETAGIAPVLGFALVGLLGVGSQWLAWRLRMPAIVLMLAAGLLVGPGIGLLDPGRDFGALMQPMVAIAVAIILFEGGMSLNRQSLSDAATGVRRLVLVGGPLGWIASSLALHWAADLSWETSIVHRFAGPVRVEHAQTTPFDGRLGERGQGRPLLLCRRRYVVIEAFNGNFARSVFHGAEEVNQRPDRIGSHAAEAAGVQIPICAASAEFKGGHAPHAEGDTGPAALMDRPVGRYD